MSDKVCEFLKPHQDKYRRRQSVQFLAQIRNILDQVSPDDDLESSIAQVKSLLSQASNSLHNGNLFNELPYTPVVYLSETIYREGMPWPMDGVWFLKPGQPSTVDDSKLMLVDVWPVEIDCSEFEVPSKIYTSHGAIRNKVLECVKKANLPFDSVWYISCLIEPEAWLKEIQGKSKTKIHVLNVRAPTK